MLAERGGVAVFAIDSMKNGGAKKAMKRLERRVHMTREPSEADLPVDDP